MNEYSTFREVFNIHAKHGSLSQELEGLLMLGGWEIVSSSVFTVRTALERPKDIEHHIVYILKRLVKHG